MSDVKSTKLDLEVNKVNIEVTWFHKDTFIVSSVAMVTTDAGNKFSPGLWIKTFERTTSLPVSYEEKVSPTGSQYGQNSDKYSRAHSYKQVERLFFA